MIVCQTNKQKPKPFVNMRVPKNISHCFVFICHQKKKKASIFHLCVIEERYCTSTRIMGSELSMHWWGSTAHNSTIHLLVEIISTVICRVKGPV